MVAKISVGKSLYGVLAYNAEKVNRGQGRLIGAHRIPDSCDGTVNVFRSVEAFSRYMPPHTRTEKPVIHISLNPHPDDCLSDVELENLAREYMERTGFGKQPYLIFKHEDIDRHHLHIVSIRTDENGRCISGRYNFYKSREVTRALERKYGLRPADRRQLKQVNPLRKVNPEAGNLKKQLSGTLRSLIATYKFRTMGEFRALLSLYHITVEETHGIIRDREYHGLVYSVTDPGGNKTGNPLKASKIGEAVGYSAVQRHLAYSAEKLKDRKAAERTRRTAQAVLKQTFHKSRFTQLLHEKGIDVVLRHTEQGRIYGATFIDHRTGCVLNGSAMGKELSANALQEHFTLPYEGAPSVPIILPENKPVREAEAPEASALPDDTGTGIGMLVGDCSGVEAQEAAFDRALRRKKKKGRKGPRL